MNDIECLWLEVSLKNRHFLFGTFYRPPNSPAVTLTRIEESIGLAVDTNVDDIIVTGDFNYDMLKPQSSSKINSVCLRYGLSSVVSEPTHFTESSSSLIDLILLSTKLDILYSGVGEPFLDQNIRYHCPVYGLLNMSTPKKTTFKRRVWKYDDGEYGTLRRNVAEFN